MWWGGFRDAEMRLCCWGGLCRVGWRGARWSRIRWDVMEWSWAGWEGRVVRLLPLHAQLALTCIVLGYVFCAVSRAGLAVLEQSIMAVPFCLSKSPRRMPSHPIPPYPITPHPVPA